MTPHNAARSPDLSHGELDVLVLKLDGLTGKQIAARLYLAESTVGARVTRIRFKLGYADDPGWLVKVARRLAQDVLPLDSAS